MKTYVLHAHMTMTMMRSPQRKWSWCASSAIAGPCTRAAYADARALGGRSLASRRWSVWWASRSRRAGILTGLQVRLDPGRTYVLCHGLDGRSHRPTSRFARQRNVSRGPDDRAAVRCDNLATIDRLIDLARRGYTQASALAPTAQAIYQSIDRARPRADVGIGANRATD